MNPKVSVCVVTYNHEKYISECLDSIVCQKTDFEFEVIVYDDASTDSTPPIIERYADKYPNLIKPILSKTNLYSQGVDTVVYTAKKSEAEFVALCEGDDYWCDENKLQNQYAALNENSSCDLAFHSCFYKYSNKLKKKNEVAKKQMIVGLKEVVQGGGSFMSTASLMLKRDVFFKLPDWFSDAPVGDFYVQVYGAIRGGALFLPECMSVYRCMSEAGWSNRVSKQNLLSNVRHLKKVVKTYDCLENELPISCKQALNLNRAKAFYGAASKALTSKNYMAFRILIDKSWAICQGYSFSQKILFFFKKHPRLAIIIRSSYRLYLYK